MAGENNMTASKHSAAEAQLRPLALTVTLAVLAAAAILLGSVTMQHTPMADGAYEINASR
jgi:hypothetical protein